MVALRSGQVGKCPEFDCGAPISKLIEKRLTVAG
jgi:hypothetical protein